MLIRGCYYKTVSVRNSIQILMSPFSVCVCACARERKLSSLLPAHVVGGLGMGLLSTLRLRAGRRAELEQSLLKEYHTLNMHTEPRPLILQYLSICHTLPYYGSVHTHMYACIYIHTLSVCVSYTVCLSLSLSVSQVCVLCG